MPITTPSVTSMPRPARVALPDRGHGAVTLSVHQAGPESATTAVVFSHGFPELGYSWRYQLPALAQAGYRVVAPDQRGYGASDAPESVEAYVLDAMCSDLDSLCAALGVERAIFVGHDWGGAVTWAMPALHPERVAGVVGVCTPFMQFPTTAFLKMLVDGEIDRQYMLWFQEPGVAEAAMEPHIDRMFRGLMGGGLSPEEAMGRAFADGKLDMNPFRDMATLEGANHPIVSDAEIQHYIDVFTASGLRGGINWYRNLDRNSELYPAIGNDDPGVPCLMVCAEWDPVLSPALAANMPNQIADLEMYTIPKAGHWVQQETPAPLNGHLLDWLQRRFPVDQT
jgi:pimeloyl-ACP methyl ester carboxylesterase